MKNLLFLGLAGILVISSCTKDNVVESLLTEQEKADLIFIRQEEKLAHDVYVYAFDKYDHFIFNNISKSEQTHIDHVAGLLNKYQIADPADGLALGIFADNNLQVLYNTLIAKVDLSLKDALEVGETIEDLDISDLKNLIANTTKVDLIKVYEVLTCGSRNHLRGFDGQLKILGITYSPQYLSQQEFETILNGSHENCNW